MNRRSLFPVGSTGDNLPRKILKIEVCGNRISGIIRRLSQHVLCLYFLTKSAEFCN